MKVRLMTPEDYPGVYALWTSTPGMGMRTLDDSEEGIAKFLVRNPSTCFVAVKDGTYLGCALSGHDGRRGFLYHVCVDPARRRQGIGAILVDHVLTSLKWEGINRVALVVYKNNPLGNPFWQKQGWTLREDLNYYNISLNEENR